MLWAKPLNAIISFLSAISQAVKKIKLGLLQLLAAEIAVVIAIGVIMRIPYFSGKA